MRQIVIDTETTGLLPEEGHRVIEIAGVELINRRLTGKKFHHYLNPNQQVASSALAVHGITNLFLQDKPTFAEIFPAFLDFMTHAEIIAHNAPFDIGFLVNEIKLLAQDPTLLTDKITVLDTLTLARQLFPGQRNSLDALCKRYKIDTSARTLHGALLDANLLAKVYLAMTGGQTSLFTESLFPETTAPSPVVTTKNYALPVIYANATELALHEAKMASLQPKKADPQTRLPETT